MLCVAGVRSALACILVTLPQRSPEHIQAAFAQLCLHLYKQGSHVYLLYMQSPVDRFDKLKHLLYHALYRGLQALNVSSKLHATPAGQTGIVRRMHELDSMKKHMTSTLLS
jgi:hypothetical protein